MDDRSPGDKPPDDVSRFKTEAWPLLPSLMRVAVILTHDHHRAEDLVQETMMRAYRHIQTFTPGTNMKAWLMTILRRTHIDLYRKDKRTFDTGSLDAMDHEPAATGEGASAMDTAWTEPEQLMQRFDDDAIEDALRALPDAMRWVLLLLDVEQMQVNEVADVLLIVPGTVKSRASRARARLRELLLPIARQRGWLPAMKGDQP